jgi:protein-tyrosine phosphatase
MEEDEYLTELPYGLPGRVFRSPMPFSNYDPFHRISSLYEERDVSAVVLLVNDAEAERKAGRSLREYYRARGLGVIHVPSPDFSVPEMEDLRQGVDEAYQLACQGKNLAIHCHAGIGRTGLFAACLARKVLGLSGDEAAAWVRRYVPHAVEVESQHAMLAKF